MGKILNFIVILFLPAVAYSHEINLTPIEKVYIKKNPTISIAVLSESWSPYIEKTPVGEYNGIHIDYIKNITSIIGVKVKYNTFDSVDELLKSVAEGESDIAVGFSQTPERDRTFSFSVPFLRAVLPFGIEKPERLICRFKAYLGLVSQGLFTAKD